ncbi:MAG: hypothetical protein HY699_09285 [Deltaproteobacteria bacterium]|nr:hypothetical protein [Deltaproteobacteria bacterium]
MIVAAGRVVLEQWYSGALTRAEAVRATTRGVSALLQAFTTAARGRASSSTRRRSSSRLASP